ncbi:hypothetical protein [Halobaculum roseum]|uniref:Uncharacterized protein n=1 Tax=Halobaculum roseum TaxID=2175149 RepID=A0ABD5MKB8_9EURY|nr:hypothetical protein [Halobaculum roseum]QZY04234.1 hypothetical protein K6T36_16100 [Halobaculum roseum]
MGLFETLFNSSTSDHVPQSEQPDQHERLPDEKYNVAYPVAARREELTALEQLLESEQDSPTAFEADPFLGDIIEDMEQEEGYPLRLRTSSERLVDDVREYLEYWNEQVDGQIGTIWWPIGADTTFRLYLHYLEVRADAEDDQFSFPESAGQVHTLVQRGLTTMEDDDNSKLALVHKRDIPLEEFTEDQ